jgi:epoxyqueuosine reductase
MNPAERSVEVKRRATALGFTLTGVTRLDRNPHAAELDAWLAAGHAGTMTYLHRQAERRKDPRRIMPAAKSAVVTLTNYFHGTSPPCSPSPRCGEGDGGRGRVAQYAWSPDYHELLGERLEELAAAIGELIPGSASRCYVDAGPVPERELAQLAGLGWIGKNMMLINPEIGSFTFIGVVLTDAELEPDLPFEADRCGSCQRCLDACPTQAFVGPRNLDARACISYLTIEHRGEFTGAQREQVGEWLFGCDVCQDVCPWNVTFAHPTSDAAFAPRGDVAAPDPDAIVALSDEAFALQYAATPFSRPGPAGMRRNAAAVRAR